MDRAPPSGPMRALHRCGGPREETVETDASTPITYRPIGVVRSPFRSPQGMPVQPLRGKEVRGRVEVLPEFAAGLADLDGFSHIYLLCHMHRVRPYRLSVVPFLDDQARGLFSTRAPSRPNPIGLSVVRLLAVEGTTLEIAELDLLDGTPVLDIKPYVGSFDERPGARLGWLERVQHRRKAADGRFGDEEEPE